MWFQSLVATVWEINGDKHIKMFCNPPHPPKKVLSQVQFETISVDTEDFEFESSANSWVWALGCGLPEISAPFVVGFVQRFCLSFPSSTE